MYALVMAVMLLQAGAKPDTATLAEEVRRTERAFARSMADRDHAAFASFLADDTIFLGRRALRGKAAVAEAWKRFYDGPAAPFAWAPEKVEVNDSGTLGLSTGPVFGPDGKRSGQFNSIWRREKDGTWKIVFDNGCDCFGEAPPARPVAPSPASQPAR